MGAAVQGRGDAGVGAQDSQVVFGIAAAQKHLVEAPPGGEDAEGVDDGLEPRHGKARCDAGHIGFRDAAVNGPILVGCAVFQGADAAHQVRVEIDDVGVALQDLGDGGPQDFLAEALVHFAVVYDLHSLSPPARRAQL